jgi:hypothetical protein
MSLPLLAPDEPPLAEPLPPEKPALPDELPLPEETPVCDEPPPLLEEPPLPASERSIAPWDAGLELLPPWDAGLESLAHAPIASPNPATGRSSIWAKALMLTQS